MGFVGLRHVGSSRTRNRTRVPALAGGFLTTAPPEKSHHCLLNQPFLKCLLKACYVPGTVLHTESVIMNRSSGACIVVLGRQNKQVDKKIVAMKWDKEDKTR